MQAFSGWAVKRARTSELSVSIWVYCWELAVRCKSCGESGLVFWVKRCVENLSADPKCWVQIWAFSPVLVIILWYRKWLRGNKNMKWLCFDLLHQTSAYINSFQSPSLVIKQSQFSLHRFLTWELRQMGECWGMCTYLTIVLGYKFVPRNYLNLTISYPNDGSFCLRCGLGYIFITSCRLKTDDSAMSPFRSLCKLFKNNLSLLFYNNKYQNIKCL